MERAFTREGIGAGSETTLDQSAVHRPDPRTRIQRLKPPALGPDSEQLGPLEEVVILHGFGERQPELAFRGDVGRTFHLLLDPECQRHLPRIELQSGELLILLVDHGLQALVAGLEGVGFAFQRVVVRDFADHAGITGDESEERKTAKKGESENGVNGLMRDMDSSEPAAEGMGEHHYKVFLFHFIVSPAESGKPVPGTRDSAGLLSLQIGEK
jgi:hypothetical protein